MAGSSKLLGSSAFASISKLSNLILSDRHPLAIPVNPLILRRILFPKLLIRFPRLPKIQRQINPLSLHILYQQRPTIRCILRKQPRPSPVRPIYLLKLFLTSRLDFELP